MPTTYQLISKNVLGANAASVTFSSIPSTYTDLILRINALRNDGNQIVNIRYNNDGTVSNWGMSMEGTGTVTNSQLVNDWYVNIQGGANMNTDATSIDFNVYSNTEIYIPNYTVARYKPMVTSHAREKNATASADNNVGGWGHVWANNATISTILVTTPSAQWVAGSVFALYGISKS